MITFAAIKQFVEDRDYNPLAGAWEDMVHDCDRVQDEFYYEPKEYREEAEEWTAEDMSDRQWQEYLDWVEEQGGWPPLEGWETGWA